jgi:hypothetical protein
VTAAEVIPFPTPSPIDDPPLFAETMAAVGLETGFVMAFALDELGPGERAVIGLAAENEVRRFVDHLPQVGRP